MSEADEPLRTGTATPGSQALRRYRAREGAHVWHLTAVLADGAFWFRDPVLAAEAVACIEAVPLHYPATLHAYVVMPDHIHVLLEVADAALLSAAFGKCKEAIARRCNRRLKRHGPLWQDGFHDRRLRLERASPDRQTEMLRQAATYIEGNPVRRSLVQSAGDWPYSSAAAPPAACP